MTVDSDDRKAALQGAWKDGFWSGVFVGAIVGMIVCGALVQVGVF